MIEISHADASAAILRHVDDGTLVQKQWHGRDHEGREVACLLGAIHPKVKGVADCNGNLMPLWFAELTPTLFDSIPAEQIFPIGRRYGELVARWHVLSPAQWEAILTRVLIRCIDDAVAAALPVSEGSKHWPAVEAACAQAKAAIKGGDRAAARAAAGAAWAAWAAAGAAWAAWAAARAAEAAAGAAAGAAAWAAAGAARAAWAAAGAARAAEAAAEAAARAAYLSLFSFVLDQIEAECGAAACPRAQ